ncbi:MAG: hypothetical protein H8E86_01435 [Planctomycetes bacterium]|nr:hypothetical protein [Planctomycetota bacterium]
MSTTRNGLVALNTALLVVLAAVSFAPVSDAQEPVQGQYLAVSGNVNGLNSGVVYIVDTQRNGAMVASTWRHNADRIVILGKRSITEDAVRALRK